MQQFTIDKLSQTYLLNNYNEFAAQAALYLDTTPFKPLDEKGCCLAFALCNLQKAHQGTAVLNEFYTMCNIIAQHFSPVTIAELIKKAKLSPEEQRAYTDAGKKIPEYNDFRFQYSATETIRFEKIVEFMSTVASAQSGYSSKMALGRFGQETSITSKGTVESITANFDNNHLIQCNAQTIAACLREAGLADNRYALITTGGHAINYRKEGHNSYYVYDPNQKIRPQRLKSLEEVGQAIAVAFAGRLDHVTASDNMILSIQGLSFGHGQQALLASITAYKQSLFHSRPVGGLAKECHDIVLGFQGSEDDLMAMAADHYFLYSRLKESDNTAPKIDTMQDYVRRLPPALQSVVKESLDYFRRAAFSDSVEGKVGIAYDPNALSASQLDFMTKLNGYMAQHHEGHLARADLAMNAVALVENATNLDEFPSALFATLLKLKNDMACFLEGEVVTSLISQGQRLVVNEQDSKGFSVANRCFLESPNAVSLQQLATQAQHAGQAFTFNGEGESKDKDALTRLLVQGSIDTINVALSQFDCRPALTKATLVAMLKSGNLDVIEHWLSQPLPERYQDLDVPNMILKTKIQTNDCLSVALSSQHQRLAKTVLDNALPLSKENAKKLLTLAHTDQRWQGIIQHIIASPDENNRTVLFEQAIAQGYLAVAKTIVLNSPSAADVLIDRQTKLLLLAAEKGDSATVDKLIDDNPVLMNAKDAKGVSVLSRAALGGQFEVVELLMQKGVTVKDDSSSPLVYAALSATPRICTLLLDKGATLEERSTVTQDRPLTALMLSAVATPEKQALINLLFDTRDDEVVRLEPERLYLVHEAITAVVKSPSATIEDFEMIVKKFNVDLTTVPLVDDRSLALQALKSKNWALATVLLEIPGIHPAQKTVEGSQMLSLLATEIKKQEDKKSSDQQKFDPKPLEAMVALFNEVIEQAPEAVNHVGQGGVTLLMQAAMSRNTEIITKVINEIADVNARDQSGLTALHYTALSGVSGNMAVLLDKRADMTVKDSQGMTAMHYLAKQSTTFDALQQLQGEQPLEATDNKGNTVLHFAVKKPKNTQTIKALMAAGLDPLQKNTEEDNAQSALDITLHQALLSAAEGKKIHEQAFGNLAMVLQAVSAKALEQNRPILDQLKQHKRAILVAYKANIAHAYANAPTDQTKRAVVAELDRTLRGQDAIGRLYKTKVRLSEFRIDNKVMKELADFKRGLLSNVYIEPNRPVGPGNR